MVLKTPTRYVLISALCALVSPALTHAQDMSFDLDEAESDAAPEADAEAGGEAGAEAGGEVEMGGEAEAGGGAAAGGGGDLLDELTSDDDMEEEAGDRAPREKEVVEEIYAVQRMYVLRNGRFELAPSVAFTVNDPYVSHPSLAVGLNYWVTNVLAVGGSFLWYQGVESESDLNFSIRRSTRLAVPITQYQLGAHLNFTYVPIYGKFTMFNSAIFQWDSYLVGGVGMVRTRPVAVVDPAVRSFDFDWRVSFNAGIGIRVFLSKYLTVFGEMRDYMYLEKLENLDVRLGEERESESTWIDQNATLTNNVSLHVGITLFLPFTFEYTYPK
ncbi:MAG: outer membrane beta-barrel domain-containing protein [Myxococcales bacterium]|nr:outer membrane beta-barrel domain-containing protein [Myxococcales bacterium]